jgi:hypothetical protein
VANDGERVRTDYRWVAIASLAVLGVGLLGVIAGLIILGKQDDSVQDAITGLATIGAGLTGGFAGWFARGVQQGRDEPASEQSSIDG